MSFFSAAPKDTDNTGGGTQSEYTRLDFNEHVIDRDNPLQRYDSVAWKFKLFTMSAGDYRKYQGGNTDITEYVISETGASSRYSIDAVEIKTVAPGQKATKNSTMQSATITMSEQGSMRFYDDLQAASAMLGFTQLFDVPIFIELSFKGFDRFGGTPVTVPNTTKLWRVRFNKIDTRLENNGGTTVYDISVTPMVFSTPPDDWRLGEQIELNATRDVGSFIDAFSEKLNAVHDSQYGYLTQMFAKDLQANNFYTFHVHPRLRELVLINDFNADTAQDSINGEKASKRFVFKASNTIGNCIDMVMDAAESKGKTQDTDKINKRQFVNVVPVADYVGYDRFRKKHVYRYDVYIIPFRTLDYLDVDDTNNSNKAQDLKELLEEAHDSDRFNMKRYDYQWSGLNTEILNLDLEFNSAYTMLAPKNLASKYDPYNRRGVKSPELTPYDQIASPEKLQELYLRKKELTSKAERTEEENQELQSVDTQLNLSFSIEGDQSQADANQADTVYLENLRNDIDLSEYTETYDGESLAVNVQVDYGNVDEITSGTDDTNASQSVLTKRMIKSNYYNDAFMMKLNMTVVGDPYWLGKSELELIDEIKAMVETNASSLTDPETLSMNVIDCEPCLVLNLEPAKGYSETTGLAISDPEGIFTQGVYRVLTVTSRFEAGSFTQDLEAAIITRSVNKGR